MTVRFEGARADSDAYELSRSRGISLTLPKMAILTRHAVEATFPSVDTQCVGARCPLSVMKSNRSSSMQLDVVDSPRFRGTTTSPVKKRSNSSFEKKGPTWFVSSPSPTLSQSNAPRKPLRRTHNSVASSFHVAIWRL